MFIYLFIFLFPKRILHRPHRLRFLIYVTAIILAITVAHYFSRFWTRSSDPTYAGRVLTDVKNRKPVKKKKKKRLIRPFRPRNKLLPGVYLFSSARLKQRRDVFLDCKNALRLPPLAENFLNKRYSLKKFVVFFETWKRYDREYKTN